MDDQAGRPSLLEVAQQSIRTKHYSIRTDYVYEPPPSSEDV